MTPLLPPRRYADPSSPPWRLLAWISRQAWLLLALSGLFWGGNVVAARMAVGEISPMVVVAGRWAIVATVLVLVGRTNLRADFAAVRPRWAATVLMAGFGFTAFNALFYAAAAHTSGVNMAIVQGAVPGFVFLGGWLFLRVGITLVQGIGLAMSVAGVVILASRGDLATLRDLHFNTGDMYNLVASLIYAGYVLALRDRPKVSAAGFFTVMALIAFVTSLPLVAVEIAEGAAFWPSWKGLAILCYIALLPSLLAQLCFIRGVELVGPGRAGLFYNLTPGFGALLSVLILGEPFAPYHVVSLALVLGGILVAESFRRSTVAAGSP